MYRLEPLYLLCYKGMVILLNIVICLTLFPSYVIKDVFIIHRGVR